MVIKKKCEACGQVCLEGSYDKHHIYGKEVSGETITLCATCHRIVETAAMKIAKDTLEEASAKKKREFMKKNQYYKAIENEKLKKLVEAKLTKKSKSEGWIEKKATRIPSKEEVFEELEGA